MPGKRRHTSEAAYSLFTSLQWEPCLKPSVWILFRYLVLTEQRHSPKQFATCIQQDSLNRLLHQRLHCPFFLFCYSTEVLSVIQQFSAKTDTLLHGLYCHWSATNLLTQSHLISKRASMFVLRLAFGKC